MDRLVSDRNSGVVHFDTDHDEFRASFRTFLEREAASGNLLEQAADHGFIGVQVPEGYGGGGADDCRFDLAAAEEFMRAGLTGSGLSFATHVGVAIPWLLEHLEADRLDGLLPSLVAAKRLAAVANSTLPATRVAGGIRLDGALTAVVNAASASLLLVPVRTETDTRAVAVVDTSAAGVSREPAAELVGTYGAALADVRLDGVIIADSAVHEGRALERLRLAEHFWLAVLALAGSRAVLDWTIDYVRQRKVFGRTVASFENTRHVLGGLSADITAVESLVAACVADHGQHRLGSRPAAAAKLRATELFASVADQGLQLHGGYGYMREYPIAQAYADSRHLRLQGGANAGVKDMLATDLGL